MRSVTVAGAKRVLGSPLDAPGRNFLNHVVELFGRQHSPHQVGLGQAGREEIGAARLPPGWNVGILCEISPCPLVDQRNQALVTNGVGIVVRECEPKGRVWVHAGSYRIRLLGEVLEIARARSRRRAA